MLLAMFNGPAAMWSPVEFLCLVVLVAAALAIAYRVLKYYGFTIPSIFIEIVMIAVVAVVAILAIRFVATL